MADTSTTSGFSPVESEAHAHLKVKQAPDMAHLSQVNNTSIVAEEVAEVAADCPVVLLRDEQTGRFQLTALFGLSKDENLLVDPSGHWTGTYIPVGLEIAPFGFFIDRDEDQRLQINIQSPLLSEHDGRALFENGQESRYLKQVREQLELVHDASLQTEAFIESLVNRNLITECKLILERDGVEPEIIGDFYTINTAEFPYMTEDDVLNFHRMGYWLPIYAMKQSLNQFKRMALLKRQRERSGPIRVKLHIDSDDE